MTEGGGRILSSNANSTTKYCVLIGRMTTMLITQICGLNQESNKAILQQIKPLLPCSLFSLTFKLI